MIKINALEQWNAHKKSVDIYVTTCINAMRSVTTIPTVTFVSTFTGFTQCHMPRSLNQTRVAEWQNSISDSSESELDPLEYVETICTSGSSSGMYSSVTCIYNIYTCMYTTDPTIKLKTFTALIQELQTTVTKENQPVLPYFDHVNTCLHNAVLSCRAALKIAHKGKSTAKFCEKENIPPGKDQEHQWRFTCTSHKCGLKRAGNTLRY